MTQTYFLDIDGVLVQHQGSLIEQAKSSLKVLKETRFFLDSIEKKGAKIILTTGRKASMRKQTEEELSKAGIFYDDIIMGCNRGSRIIVNDLKPDSNLKTAFSFSPVRNQLDKDELEKIINPCEERPWGNFSTLAYDKKYHVKEIKVLPGKSSSLQSHNHRNEVWVVVCGNGKMVIDDKTELITFGSVCHVLKGQKHKVINTGTNDLIFIEVQYGEKFSENDIIRYEDEFGRV